MITNRLTVAEAATQGRLISAEDVFPGEPRLWHLDETACRQLVAQEPPIASFVLWPDRSMGLVHLNAYPSLEFGMAAAYVTARFTLEQIFTHCAVHDERPGVAN